MKKFFFLLIAAVALSASAGNLLISKQDSMNHKRMVPGRTSTASQMPKQNAPKHSAVIINQPEGELKTYNRSGGCYRFGGVAEQEGKAYIVFGENNKVYLLDPVYSMMFGSWVEGTLSEDGTKIIVPMGQPIFDFGVFTLNLCWMTTNYEYQKEFEEYNITHSVDESVTEAIYSINDGVISLEGSESNIYAEYPECLVMSGLSIVNSIDGSWSDCVDCGTVYTELPVVVPPHLITEQPEGELVEYVRSGECIMNSMYGTQVTEQKGIACIVYGDNNKVYLKDPIFGAPIGTWVEGYLSDDGTTITVPMNQYIFWDEYDERGLILKDVTVSINENNRITSTVNESTEMIYTIDGETITLNDTYGDMNAERPTEMRGLSSVWDDNLLFGGAIDWKTKYEQIALTAAIPADPSLDPEDIHEPEAWSDFGELFGFSRFLHYIKLEDIDGNPINADYVTYSIFTDDDQIFTFEKDVYINDNLTEDVTEIPYNHNGYGYDLGPNATFFYRSNAPGFETFFTRRIGIQVYYTIDGIRNASNIVYYYLPGPDTNIDEIKGDKAIKCIRYYNMVGQEMTEAKGICIAVTSYTDGTTSAVKVVK